MMFYLLLFEGYRDSFYYETCDNEEYGVVDAESCDYCCY